MSFCVMMLIKRVEMSHHRMSTNYGKGEGLVCKHVYLFTNRLIYETNRCLSNGRDVDDNSNQ